MTLEIPPSAFKIIDIASQTILLLGLVILFRQILIVLKQEKIQYLEKFSGELMYLMRSMPERIRTHIAQLEGEPGISEAFIIGEFMGRYTVTEGLITDKLASLGTSSAPAGDMTENMLRELARRVIQNTAKKQDYEDDVLLGMVIMDQLEPALKEFAVPREQLSYYGGLKQGSWSHIKTLIKSRQLLYFGYALTFVGSVLQIMLSYIG